MANSKYSSLEPNAVYNGKNDSVYHTDHAGRISWWRGHLEKTAPEDRERYNYAQRTLEGKGEHDHAGHFISAQDGGDPGKINLSAQEEHVNTRDYRAFERENHALVEQGYYVELIGEVSYPMGSDVNRPEAYMVERIATNEKGEEIDHSYFSFTNENMAEFELIGEEEASEQQFELVNPSEVVCDQEQNIITDSETGAIISDSAEISTEETSDVETTGSEEVEADVNVETETEAETL